MLQILELPHASVEAVVDILMKTDLSPVGIETLEAAARSQNRSTQGAQQAGVQPKTSLFHGQIMQQNGNNGQLQQHLQPGQQPPFGGIHLAMNQPKNGEV